MANVKMKIRDLRHLHDRLVQHKKTELESLMKDMTIDDMIEVSREIDFVAGDRKTLICVNGYTANKFFTELFKPVLDDFYRNYEVRVLEHEDNLDGEVRRILTPAEKIRVPDAKVLLTFVYSAEGGRTQLGSLDFALTNAEMLGIEEVYTLIGLDYQGCCHFPIARLYSPEQYLNPWEFFEIFAYQAYKKHEKKGNLRYIGKLVPERNYITEEYEKPPSPNSLKKLLYKVTGGKYGGTSSPIDLLQIISEKHAR